MQKIYQGAPESKNTCKRGSLHTLLTNIYICSKLNLNEHFVCSVMQSLRAHSCKSVLLDVTKSLSLTELQRQAWEGWVMHRDKYTCDLLSPLMCNNRTL